MSYVFPNSKLSNSAKAAIICALISGLGFIANKLFLEVKIYEPERQPVATKILKFEDQKDGAVVVIDSSSNKVIDVIHGEAGFVRGILRTVARERRIHGIGQDEPLFLMAYDDGRLILKDPTTNTKIELESFGSTNVEDFRVFLKKDRS
jgi:putative photosynthetic complex assembly protein